MLGSSLQIGKPRGPDRVEVSSFGAVGPRKYIGKQLNGGTVGNDDPKFMIGHGFQEISHLIPIMGLGFPGVRRNTM